MDGEITVTQAQLSELTTNLIALGATFEVKVHPTMANQWIVLAQRPGDEFTGTQMNNQANNITPPVTATTNIVKFS